jgi:uncharacterized protein YbbC (DUF1343 family)
LRVLNGIDVLIQSDFEQIAGCRIGLVTNHTGRCTDGRSTADILHDAANVELTALFGPEHGIRGVRDEAVDDDVDAITGLPVYSLYGTRNRPTADQCVSFDVFVFDIQDIGCRFYTYLSTLGNVLEAAHEFGKRVVVLDRPNPIGGQVSGPMPDEDRLSFTAYHEIPVRHGLTMGELARLIHKERKLVCALDVVTLKNWRRNQWFDETGLTWINPSPNMRSLYAAALYPGIGLLEFTNISVGRGTDRPFELLGSPFIEGDRLAELINAARIEGVRAMAVEFTPSVSVYQGERCSGIMLNVLDRNAMDPVKLGLWIAHELIGLYPEEYSTKKLDTLLVNAELCERLVGGESVGRIVKEYEGNYADIEGRFAGIRLYD